MFFLSLSVFTIAAFASDIIVEPFPTVPGVSHNLSWFIADDQITFTYTKSFDYSVDSAFLNHWTAFSLNTEKHAMSGSDFIVVLKDCDVSDRFSYSKSVPRLDSDFNGYNDITVLDRKIGLHGNSIQCIFRRKLATGDAFDVIINDSVIKVGFATGPTDTSTNALLKHQQTIKSFNVNFIQGTVELVSNGSASKYNPFESKVYWHGVLMVASFLMIMFPASFIARYLKFSFPLWFFYHRLFQLLACAAFLVSIILISVELGLSQVFDNLLHGTPSDRAHGILGLCLLVFLFTQAILGYLSNALWYEGKAPGLFPDILHWWIGRLTMLMGASNVLIGVYLYCEKYLEIQWESTFMFGSTIATFVLIAVFHLVFEVFVGQKHEHESDNDTSVDEERKLFDQESTSEPLEQFKSVGFWNLGNTRSISVSYFLLNTIASLLIILSLSLGS